MLEETAQLRIYEATLAFALEWNLPTEESMAMMDEIEAILERGSKPALGVFVRRIVWRRRIRDGALLKDLPKAVRNGV